MSSIETRSPEWKPGDWLTQCAWHPFTIWASESWIDAEGKVRCRKFCGQYQGSRTLKEQSSAIAQAHKQVEAPAPPRTVPRPQAKDYLGPWARWPMQNTVSRLQDAAGVHDGIASPFAASLVDGRLGSKAFRFNGTAGYKILNSEGASPTKPPPPPPVAPAGGGGFAVAAWIKPSAFPASNEGTIIAKMPTSFILGWDLEIIAPDQVTFFFGVTAPIGNYQIGVSTPSVPTLLTAWHHVAADWTGDTMAIYLDGVLADSKPSPLYTASEDPIAVGTFFGYPSPFIGDIYDVRYLMHPFAAGELAWIMSGNS